MRGVWWGDGLVQWPWLDLGWGIYGSPGVGGAFAAALVDLEPDGIGSGGPVLAAGVGAAGHVGDEGSDVGVGPEGPAEGHGRAGRGIGVERGGHGASVALDVDGRGILDGAVAGDGARDSLGLKVERSAVKIRWFSRGIITALSPMYGSM
jgi:hypothetical protein